MSDTIINDEGRRTYAIADQLRELLTPVCERIEIAGSIRRGKPDPHDIELVCVPKMEAHPFPSDLFGEAWNTRDLLAEALGEWLGAGVLDHRRDKNGRPAWGDRFRRTVYNDPAFAGSFPLDIFSVLPPAQWGVIFAIRTGPADFGKSLVTSRLEGGFMPPGMHVKDGQLWRNGGLVPTLEESDYFREIGVPCWPPEERSLLRLHRWRRQQAARQREEAGVE